MECAGDEMSPAHCKGKHVRKAETGAVQNQEKSNDERETIWRTEFPRMDGCPRNETLLGAK